MQPPAAPPPMTMKSFTPQVPGQALSAAIEKELEQQFDEQCQLYEQLGPPALPQAPKVTPQFPPPPAWNAILDAYFQGPGGQHLADLVAESVEQALQQRGLPSLPFGGIKLPKPPMPPPPKSATPTPPAAPSTVRTARIVRPPGQ